MQTEASHISSRRSFLATLAGAATAAFAGPSSEKPLRGIFIIAATPYNKSKAIDYEDLAHEIEWLNRCGAHGIVWPQMASEYNRLTVEERLRGFEVIADAAKGKRSAVVFGVQGPDTNAALNYLRHAEKLSPDALIAIPPEKASSLEDYRAYYGALARATERPIFIQDTGPHHPIPMPASFLLELASAYPNLGYVKEELSPVLERMRELQGRRPPMKRVFSGDGGRGMLAEMNQGSDGTMPAAGFTDVYVQIWDAWQAGDHKKVRDIFIHLLPLINLAELVDEGYQPVMHRRGVFKTAVSRLPHAAPSPEVQAEIDAAYEDVKPYLRV
ncbi:MAG TPA: dihydrodipicolinate synthase family protein [Bryobacteraceae bacterium]|nr:dihydrodipicolinate synthase family protein [Bryobacteraceae bacterium]